MAVVDSQVFIKQLDDILSSYAEIKSKSRHKDLSDTSSSDMQRIITQSRAAIMRIVRIDSPYVQQVTEILSRPRWDCDKMSLVMGVVEALKYDLEAGYMQTAEELIHGELFSDFLEMASHLLDEGYKDPAAVVCGSSLEGHLRQLAKKLGIETMVDSSSGVRPKKAESINIEICKASGYSVLDQKNVTAWLGLRNKAAHGCYDEYTIDQVKIMLAGVRDFITRNPA